MSDVENARNNPVIRKYLKDVLSWHGYIRFLGMPTLQTNPDVPLEDLYVAQSLSIDNLSTDEAPNEKALYNPVKLLLEKRHLVVLGDPGSGKSTLVNWFAWMLSSGFVDRLPELMNQFVPVTIVLRELKLENISTFESLIDAFLERPVAKSLSLNAGLLMGYFERGNVLLLVDGFDEVSIDVRQKLNKIFKTFFIKYNNCLSIFTSRRIGYEVAPIYGTSKSEHRGNENKKQNVGTDIVDIDINEVLLQLTYEFKYEPTVCYMAPFTDSQIEKFSLNWYKENVAGSQDGAQLLRDEFFASIRSNDSTLKLARTPHLLTMMALIFKVRLQLPNGRALLYELISQAYLESIDTARKLKDPFLWQEKKRWLARVAFEMQLQRLEKDKEKSNKTRELLATKAQVLGWIIDAIQESNFNRPVDIITYATMYLDWIARRSGLLLPRGEDQYAFLHLSFQEYFAAVHIQQQIENPEYFDSDSDDRETLDKRFKDKPVKLWVRERAWQQVFIFLFEIMADKPGWINKLWRELFPSDCNSRWVSAWKNSRRHIVDSNNMNPPDIELQIALLSNPHVEMNSKKSNEKIDEIITLAFEQQKAITEHVDLGSYFTADNCVLSKIIDSREFSSKIIPKIKDMNSLNGLHFCSRNYSVVLSILDSIQMPENFRKLTISNSGVVSMSIFNEFRKLEALNLSWNNISDLAGIGKLRSIKQLDISHNSKVEISEISHLKNLTFLKMSNVHVRDFSPLYDSGLEELWCSFISDLNFVMKMPKLRTIIIFSAPSLTNIDVIFSHPSIRTVMIAGSSVSKDYGKNAPSHIQVNIW